MIRDNLYIKGGAFAGTTELKGILHARMNIVFGRNGSGKSTIARAFREQQDKLSSDHPSSNYELSDTKDVTCLDREELKRVFVFNEDFVDANVKTPDKLKSIIRVGSSARLDEPIALAKKRIAETKAAIDEVSAKLVVLDASATARGSIKEAEDNIRKGLKAPDRYMARMSKLDGKTHNVTDTIMTRIKGLSVPEGECKSFSEVLDRLNANIKQYLSFQDGSEIDWSVPDVSGLLNIEEINSLLEQTVRPAALDDSERALLEELSGSLAAHNFIEKTQTVILDRAAGLCPLCHQPVSDGQIHLLEARLMKFRDKKVEDFKTAVRRLADSVCTLETPLPSVSLPDWDADFTRALRAIEALNDYILAAKEALESKWRNPFVTVSALDAGAYVALSANCKTALDKVREDVSEYNRKMHEKDALKKSIDKDNDVLAYLENKSWIEAYRTRTAEKASLNARKQQLEAEHSQSLAELGKLQAQIDQVDDAREQINNYLTLIFGYPKLRLEPAGKDVYKLSVKNGDSYVDVPARCVSSGERNAIALAYFFAVIMERKDRNYAYSDETLLIIDDPVSSFDIENKAGVISLLSMQCDKVLNGNPDSKVLVLTHDQATLRDLCVQRERIVPKANEKDVDNDYFHLLTPGHKLISQQVKFILPNMDYNDSLHRVFNFAKFNSPEDFDTYDSMGNTIRKFAEEYASRTYRCSWPQLFADPERTECVPPEYRSTICSFATRNVLNSESHGMDAAYAPGEVQRSAQVLLAYIYYADRAHLASYLVGNKAENEWKMKKVETWATCKGLGEADD